MRYFPTPVKLSGVLGARKGRSSLSDTSPSLSDSVGLKVDSFHPLNLASVSYPCQSVRKKRKEKRKRKRTGTKDAVSHVPA